MKVKETSKEISKIVENTKSLIDNPPTRIECMVTERDMLYAIAKYR